MVVVLVDLLPAASTAVTLSWTLSFLCFPSRRLLG